MEANVSRYVPVVPVLPNPKFIRRHMGRDMFFLNIELEGPGLLIHVFSPLNHHRHTSRGTGTPKYRIPGVDPHVK